MAFLLQQPKVTETESDIIPVAKRKLGVYILIIPLILFRQWSFQGGGSTDDGPLNDGHHICKCGPCLGQYTYYRNPDELY